MYFFYFTVDEDFINSIMNAEAPWKSHYREISLKTYSTFLLFVFQRMIQIGDFVSKSHKILHVLESVVDVGSAAGGCQRSMCDRCAGSPAGRGTPRAACCVPAIPTVI